MIILFLKTYNKSMKKNIAILKGDGIWPEK